MNSGTDKTYGGKVILVTGGTSGIGADIVRQLVGLGAQVYFCGRNQKAGDALVQKLSGSMGKVRFIAADVQDQVQVDVLLARLLQDAGRIDYLFHCAGIILGGEYRDHKLSDIQQVIQTNVMGTAQVTHAVYDQMVRQGSGHIINVASAAGLFPVPLMGLYSATKFFVYGLGEILRMEGKGLGVRVSTVAPGIVDTPLYDTAHYSQADRARVNRLMKSRLWTITSDHAARKIIRGARYDRAVIFTQWYGRFGWLSYRLMPHVYRWFMGRGLGPYRKRMRRGAS